jgi:hypothetical protein
MRRRLKEDHNQHYDNLDCPCWTDPKAMARFKEQPPKPRCLCCCNRRALEGPGISERRDPTGYIEEFGEAYPGGQGLRATGFVMAKATARYASDVDIFAAREKAVLTPAERDELAGKKT